jgi:O-antigen ligase
LKAHSPPEPESPRTSLPAYLLLLPVLVLAWPGLSPLAGDFATTELTAAGVAALLLVPLAGWLGWARPMPVHGFLWLFAALLLPVNFHQPSDPLEADRATLTFLIAMLVASAAAALAEQGRELVVRGLVVAALALLVPALLEGAPAWGGVLGNSGELSGAALPGALAGLLLGAGGRGPWRWVGLAAAAAFLAHALLAPVIAGLVVLAAVALVAALLGGRAGKRSRVTCAIVCGLALAALGRLKFAPPAAAPTAPTTSHAAKLGGDSAAEPATFAGGFEVRRRIWRSTAGLFLDHPLLGVGPGQFAVAFPEYRDPVERQLSNWGGAIEQVTEVENPHNDWLLPWAEGGLVAGLCWWIFLLGLGSAAWAALRKEGALTRAVAAGVLGALMAAGLNAPLLYNPTASLAAFALFGLLTGATRRRAGLGRGRWSVANLLIPGFALLFLMHVPRAWDLWRHGDALGELAHTTSTTAQALAVERALAACPDSVVARTLEARVLEGRGELEQALASWQRVLVLRPQRFEARMQRGVLLARLERLPEAQAAFDSALELDPAHAPLLRNRARCFAEQGRVPEALNEIERLEELGHYRPVWLRDLGCELVLRGKIAEALPLLARADARFADLTGEGAWGLEDDYRRGGSAMAADAFKALAYFTWARGQAREREWGDARRSYFQALRIMRDYAPPAGPTRVRLEHAAAIWQSGLQAEAREALEGLRPSALDWVALPEWAGEALFIMGFGADQE